MVERRVVRVLVGAMAVAVAAVAMASPATGTARTAGGVPAGVYRGTVTDPGGDPGTYAVRIRIAAQPLRPGHRAGTVLYQAAADEETGAPALHCTGTLSFRSRRGTRSVFRETIAGGAGRECLTGGTVTLTRRGAATLGYRWSRPGTTIPPPTATLTRQGGAS